MAHQIVFQPPHDESGSLMFRKATFCGASLKGTAVLLISALLFGGFEILFKSILPASLLTPHLHPFGASVIWGALSLVATAISVVLSSFVAARFRSAISR